MMFEMIQPRWGVSKLLALRRMPIVRRQKNSEIWQPASARDLHHRRWERRNRRPVV
jgi:hypothetical protein